MGDIRSVPSTARLTTAFSRRRTHRRACHGVAVTPVSGIRDRVQASSLWSDVSGRRSPAIGLAHRVCAPDEVRSGCSELDWTTSLVTPHPRPSRFIERQALAQKDSARCAPCAGRDRWPLMDQSFEHRDLALPSFRERRSRRCRRSTQPHCRRTAFTAQRCIRPMPASAPARRSKPWPANHDPRVALAPSQSIPPAPG
jgi:hypothetical protein